MTGAVQRHGGQYKSSKNERAYCTAVHGGGIILRTLVGTIVALAESKIRARARNASG